MYAQRQWKNAKARNPQKAKHKGDYNKIIIKEIRRQYKKEIHLGSTGPYGGLT